MWDQSTQVDEETSLVELALGHWMYWMQFARDTNGGYRKVLVPVDLTEESESVLSHADTLLLPEGEGILLHVIPSAAVAGSTGGATFPNIGSPGWTESAALEHLDGLIDRLGLDPGRWRREVYSARSIVEGVISFASREAADVIVMGTHERKGLAKLTKRSIAKEVRQKAPVEVKVFRSRELAQAAN